jgi:hypothetical protein
MGVTHQTGAGCINALTFLPLYKSTNDTFPSFPQDKSF